MKANAVRKSTQLRQDGVEDQMVGHNYADNVAIMSVVTGDDGKYLCFTDNKGAKLSIKLPGAFWGRPTHLQGAFWGRPTHLQLFFQ